MRLYLYDEEGNLISSDEVGNSIFFIGENGESGIIGKLSFTDIIEHTYQTLQHLYNTFIETVDEYNEQANKSYRLNKPSFEEYVKTSIDLGKLLLTEELSINDSKPDYNELINIINNMNAQIKNKDIKIIGVDIDELKKQMEDNDDKKPN